MQTLKTILYNASMISLLSELSRKYPHPIIVYENATNSISDNSHSEVYQALAKLNSPWISRNFANNQIAANEINFLHLFCVNRVYDSIHPIKSHILRSSNTFRIQNVVLSNHRTTNDMTGETFENHERFHWNTLVCERDGEQGVICWYWKIANGRTSKTLNDLLYGPIDLNAVDIKVRVYHSPPTTFSVCCAGRVLYAGLDAMVSAEILSTLNVTPQYCSEEIMKLIKISKCNRVDKLDEGDAIKQIRQLKYNEKTYDDQSYMHTVFDLRMVKYLFYGWPECNDSGIYLQMNTGSLTGDNSSIMKSLMPTEFSCILVTLPKSNAAGSFMRQTFFNSVESLACIFAIALFTIGRIIIERSPFKQWFDIFYSTFVVFLSQAALISKTNAERMVHGLLLVMSVIISSLLSSLIFTNLVNNPSSRYIQTLDELGASNYKILTTDNVGNWIGKLRDDIREKVVVVSHFEMLSDILGMEKTSAYAINENLIGMFKEPSSARHLKYKIRDVYYEMDEKLHCGYFAYGIARDFPLENEINDILLRMVDHGLIGAFKKWSLHIMKISVALRVFSLADENNPINLENIAGVFYAYLIGTVIGFIVFICEILTKKFKN